MDKVKAILCLTDQHIMKVCGGETGRPPVILNLSEEKLSASRPDRFIIGWNYRVITG